MDRFPGTEAERIIAALKSLVHNVKAVSIIFMKKAVILTAVHTAHSQTPLPLKRAMA
jgi:hypothetical protein